MIAEAADSLNANVILEVICPLHPALVASHRYSCQVISLDFHNSTGLASVNCFDDSKAIGSRVLDCTFPDPFPHRTETERGRVRVAI